jgi:integrase
MNRPAMKMLLRGYQKQTKHVLVLYRCVSKRREMRPATGQERYPLQGFRYPCTFLFPSERNSAGHHKNLRRTWQRTLARAKVPYFRIYDLRSTYATRLSAGGVADEWITQMLRQGDAQVFKKYSQMKLQMKREALEKIPFVHSSCTVGAQKRW